MNILSIIKDNRINSTNLLVETSFREYLAFAKLIKGNNDLQRKRVRTSKTVYSLLKTDLEQGCVIPPLVLAINDDLNQINNVPREAQGQLLANYIEMHPQNVLILDGLQRTLTLIDADIEMSNKEDYEIFLNNTLRIEFYVDINKFGILYRMLTLNTGQTPMSPRHQLEMLYSDMLDTEIEGVKLVRDVLGSADPNKREFAFSNTIEGFNSYMARSELPIDRQDMLESIKSLENMAAENVENDLFKEFLESYVKLFNAFQGITHGHVLTEEEKEEAGLDGFPFGKTAAKVFSTSQAFTGFGAAIGRMKDKGILTLEDIPAIANGLTNKYQDAFSWLIEMLLKLDKIKATSKKIGNGQRMFFHYFFRELLNKDSDSYLDLDLAVENGYKKYDSQVN